ncbi:hypothetical protein MTR67_045515 [Solanum verrucosum]|uniref:Uncharacterized protein n=1 Tax=Solanum verrucosum TaxID=315347 RepID=A0AAF0ZWQ2_SOLVR|nr:hypothetical protein MTR67_045515 [Solanum verrucosum]
MEENAAAFHTALNAAQALGRGFDVNYDTRLLYCKGVSGSRVVEIDEDHTRDLSLYDNLVLPNVSRDIKNFQEPGGRDGSSVCNYNEPWVTVAYKTTKMKAKLAFIMSKTTTFERLYVELEDKCGDKKLYMLAKAREMKARDLDHVKCIKDRKTSWDKDTVLGDSEYSKIRDFGYCRCIMVKEVKSAINKMSKGRATGPNEIPIEF